jgi:oxygen-independent coproporphyrinogen III oxidase
LAGIYIHIPFCRQACHYCNFHFTTSLRQKNELVAALLREIELQQNYLENETIETIYLGGGTPSILTIAECRLLIEKLSSQFTILPHAEITLEANPDDITRENLAAWKEIGINRLSIGVQSFFDDDLQWMNRAHSAKQAINNLQLAIRHFTNISIDLIFGRPGMTNEKWKQNVDTAIGLNIPHLSCYALTVEPNTPLQKMIRLGKMQDTDPDKQSTHFLLLMEWLESAGYEHYEISNFAKPGFRSRHNSSYWSAGTGEPQKKYLGAGPSAHSFNGNSRQWNVSNNQQYMEAIRNGIIPFEEEILTPAQKLNEYIMTSLRTSEGINLDKLEKEIADQLIKQSGKYTQSGLMTNNNNFLVLTKEGKLLADGIAAAFFV